MEFPDWVQVKEKHYRWLTRACHEITLVTFTNGQPFMYYRNKLQYSGKLEIQKQPELFRNHQSFVDCSMKGLIIFLIDLESIQHKLSSDYSLNICFSRRFPYIDSPSFSPYKPLQNVDFSKVGNKLFFFSGIVLTF